MRIAVIGMGNVGSVLGRRWAEAGHEVTFCVRDPDNPQKRAEAEKFRAAIGPVSDAAKAEVVLLAVPWRAVPDALGAAGDLSGKVLLVPPPPSSRSVFIPNASPRVAIALWRSPPFGPAKRYDTPSSRSSDRYSSDTRSPRTPMSGSGR